MKTMIIYFMVMISAGYLYSQSQVVYDANSSLYLGPGADLCSDSLIINGEFSGDGTFCGNPVTEVKAEEDLGIPKEFELSQNYPNPFNPATTIKFSVPEATHLRIYLYDMLGKLVATIAEGMYDAGYYRINFEAGSLASGTYIYRLESDRFEKVMKMILLK